ncbi:Conserved_hypothetical protein [Hexamita inflata]|uniref:Uncharacterized protein n=1 Tax=Hexamita inflata TaxID=28002 RepID=A0AA86NAC3_9EUKA|nr:Conserved hypothetical protein [Hexamita inflata]
MNHNTPQIRPPTVLKQSQSTTIQVKSCQQIIDNTLRLRFDPFPSFHSFNSSSNLTQSQKSPTSLFISHAASCIELQSLEFSQLESKECNTFRALDFHQKVNELFRSEQILKKLEKQVVSPIIQKANWAQVCDYAQISANLYIINVQVGPYQEFNEILAFSSEQIKQQCFGIYIYKGNPKIATKILDQQYIMMHVDFETLSLPQTCQMINVCLSAMSQFKQIILIGEEGCKATSVAMCCLLAHINRHVLLKEVISIFNQKRLPQNQVKSDNQLRSIFQFYNLKYTIRPQDIEWELPYIDFKLQQLQLKSLKHINLQVEFYQTDNTGGFVLRVPETVINHSNLSQIIVSNQKSLYIIYKPAFIKQINNQQFERVSLTHSQLLPLCSVKVSTLRPRSDDIFLNNEIFVVLMDGKKVLSKLQFFAGMFNAKEIPFEENEKIIWK